MDAPFDALIVVSFGGPEGRDEVIPFLENVLRGRNVPPERMAAVAEHYYQFGGVSPLNEQNRQLIAALEKQLQAAGIALPIYWGNRNWRPLLPEAIGEMAKNGVRRALAFVTSTFSSYSGCRQYRENIEAARQEVGPRAPVVEKLRAFYNHPGFIESQAELLAASLAELPAERRAAARVLFTAHSIPQVMSDSCDYVVQLEEACRLVAESAKASDWRLVYQSRSGPPNQPWLDPDVCDALREIAASGGSRDVVVCPIGFLSDHIEVLFDLDTEARQVCEGLGLSMLRTATVGVHARFVQMIVELVQERLDPTAPRLAIGKFGPRADECPVDCCKFERR